LVAEAEELVALGIPMIALFPSGSRQRIRNRSMRKKPITRTAWRSVRCGRLRQACPELGIMTDVALDPFTTHGQDGIIDENGYVLNDDTIDVLMKQALVACRSRARM
jgi:porphobilinogen synthase